jgi:AcrR family transcriptional regulator
MTSTKPIRRPIQRPRWHRRKEARPDEIVEAALDLFVEKGFAATRLDEVAQHAGVSKGTMYVYFDSKESLFQAVVRRSLVPALVQGEALLAAHEGPTADLVAQLMRGWWQSIGVSKVSGILKLVMAESANFPDVTRIYHSEVVQRGRQLMGDAIRRGIDRGEFRSVDVPRTVRLAMAPLLYAVIWKHSLVRCDSADMDWEAFIEAHIDLFLRGLAVGAPQERRGNPS